MRLACLTGGGAFHGEHFEREQQLRLWIARRDQPLARAVDEVLVRVVRRVHVTHHAGRYVLEASCQNAFQLYLFLILVLD